MFSTLFMQNVKRYLMRAFAFISVAWKLMFHAANYLFSAVEAAAPTQKAEEKKAVKVGDVFITFIFTLILEVILSLLLLFAFYDCSELKCFYVVRRSRSKNTVKWKCFIAHFISSYKSFYLNNIFFWHSLQRVKRTSSKKIEDHLAAWLARAAAMEKQKSCRQYFMCE